jgi:hypothetical protein
VRHAQLEIGEVRENIHDYEIDDGTFRTNDNAKGLMQSGRGDSSMHVQTVMSGSRVAAFTLGEGSFYGTLKAWITGDEDDIDGPPSDDE